MAENRKQKTLFLDDGGAASPAPPVGRAARPVYAPMPPPRRRSRAAWGRWVAGPLLAALAAAGTVAVTKRLQPPTQAVAVRKPQGLLHLDSEPRGASLFVNGKRLPRFTPADLEEEVGATLMVRFTMDGYLSRQARLVVAPGEHTFSVRLFAKQPPAPEETERSAPVAAAVPEVRPRPQREKSASVPLARLSIFVHPWAIVSVDQERLRQTPISDYELPAGKHTIELVNENKGRQETIEVDLAPGEARKIRRDWD